jgi:hypothetical protein
MGEQRAGPQKAPALMCHLRTPAALSEIRLQITIPDKLQHISPLRGANETLPGPYCYQGVARRCRFEEIGKRALFKEGVYSGAELLPHTV